MMTMKWRRAYSFTSPSHVRLCVHPSVCPSEHLVLMRLQIMNSFSAFEWDLICEPHKIFLYGAKVSLMWLFPSHLSMQI